VVRKNASRAAQPVPYRDAGGGGEAVKVNLCRRGGGACIRGILPYRSPEGEETQRLKGTSSPGRNTILGRRLKTRWDVRLYSLLAGKGEGEKSEVSKKKLLAKTQPATRRGEKGGQKRGRQVNKGKLGI